MTDFISAKRVLYVDDENINLELFKATFKRDFIVETASSAKEGLKMVKQELFDIIVTDLKMPEVNGMEFIEQIKKVDPKKICILLTAYTEPEVMIKAMNEGKVYKYMLKPWKKSDLKMVIDEALSDKTRPVGFY